MSVSQSKKNGLSLNRLAKAALVCVSVLLPCVGARAEDSRAHNSLGAFPGGRDQAITAKTTAPQPPASNGSTTSNADTSKTVPDVAPIPCEPLAETDRVKHNRYLPGDLVQFVAPTTEVKELPVKDAVPITFYRLSKTSWPDRDRTTVMDVCGPQWVKLMTPYDHGNQPYKSGWVNIANLRNLEPDYPKPKQKLRPRRDRKAW